MQLSWLFLFIHFIIIIFLVFSEEEQVPLGSIADVMRIIDVELMQGEARV